MFGKSAKGSNPGPGISSSSIPVTPVSTSSDQKNRSTVVNTLIGRGTTIDGDLQFSGNLNIEGTVKGNLTADNDESTLILSEQGRIQGEVRVSSMLLNGSIDGDVFASGKVELFEKARVCGDVYYNLLEMAVGAEVNGKLVRQKPAETPKPAPVAAKPAADSSDS